MLIENEFDVPASAERTWAFLLDVDRVARCAPGAELTDTVDDRTWDGRINVKLGPVALTFIGTVTMRERDDSAHRMTLSAKGRETRGKGAASADVTSWLEDAGTGTTVKMQTDVMLTGTVAQISRGLLPDVSRRLTAEFAECLRASIAEASATDQAAQDTDAAGQTSPRANGGPSPGSAEAVGGIRLVLWAAWRAIVRGVSRLFGRR